MEYKDLNLNSSKKKQQARFCILYIKGVFESILNAIADTCQKLLEESKSTTKVFEELDESNVHLKALELLNKSRVNGSSLIWPISKLLVPTNKRQFHFYDDPNIDIWSECNDWRRNYNIWRQNSF